jgi:hypothetical protein
VTLSEIVGEAPVAVNPMVAEPELFAADDAVMVGVETVITVALLT